MLAGTVILLLPVSVMLAGAAVMLPAVPVLLVGATVLLAGPTGMLPGATVLLLDATEMLAAIRSRSVSVPSRSVVSRIQSPKWVCGYRHYVRGAPAPSN